VSETTTPPLDLPALLADLEAAQEAATPGPWMHDGHELYQEWPGIPGVTGDWIGETCRIEGDPLHKTSDADAALIVAAVNALPTLIAELRRRDAAIRAVEALAERWSRYQTDETPLTSHAYRSAAAELDAALSAALEGSTTP
jgi:hypothetical protein